MANASKRYQAFLRDYPEERREMDRWEAAILVDEGLLDPEMDKQHEN